MRNNLNRTDVKRNAFKSMTLIVTAVFLITLIGMTPIISAADGDGKFTIAVIPDTQQEVFTPNGMFKNRTQYLANNKNALDLRFVVHTGDVVNWGVADPSQFVVASDAMKVLDDNNIPNSLALGNHDTAAVTVGGGAADPTRTKELVRDTTVFNSYFPVSRYPGIVTFEAGKVDNSYRTFSAEGKDWLVLTLELWPRTVTINWAKNVVANHPNHNVIIVTHSYLNSDGSIKQNSEYGENSPQYLYDNLVKVYPNIRFVLSGHVGNAAYRIDTGVNGNKIVSLLGCFHSNTTNPVNLLEIDASTGTASTKYYGPWTNYEWTQYRWTFTGLNFVNPGSSANGWEFNSSTESWTANSGVSGFGWQSGGYIGGNITTTDPAVISPDNIGINISNNKIVKIRMKNNSAAPTAKLYFTTTTSTSFDEAKSKSFAINVYDSNYTEYIIDMSSVSGWTGTLKRLRVDPMDTTSVSSGSFSIDYIRILSGSVAKDWFFDTSTESWTANAGVSGFGWQSGGYIGGSITTTDPAIFSPDNVGINISNNKIVKIRMKNSSAAPTAKLYFTTTTSTSFDEAKSKSFAINANDPNYTEYTIDMSNVSGWTGTLKKLRVDPMDTTSVSSGSFSIDYIRIMQ